MKTTHYASNHKVNNCVKNAYRVIAQKIAFFDIWDAYKRPSHYKIRAWEWVKAACKEDGGHGICVTGANCSKFTAAYFCSHYETGEACIVVHTADNVYWAFVDELN